MATYGLSSYGVDSYGPDPTPLGAALAVIPVAPPTELYVAPPAPLSAPADLAIGRDGEFALTPTGDLALVSGTDRLVQDLWMLAVTPLGAAVIDPAYGDAFAGMVGGRLPDASALAAAVAGVQQAATGLHRTRAAQGNQPGADELLASVDVTGAQAGADALSVDLDVTTASGQRAGLSVPVSGVGN